MQDGMFWIVGHVAPRLLKIVVIPQLLDVEAGKSGIEILDSVLRQSCSVALVGVSVLFSFFNLYKL